MNCLACQAASTRPPSGAYDFKCVHCCARLLLASDPDHARVKAQIAAIRRFREAPPLQTIFDCARRMRARRP